MKRVGHLYEKMVSMNNCIKAEMVMCKNKNRDNSRICKIKEDPGKYAAMLKQKLESGTYQFHESRVREIRDSYKGKTRKLLIPCLEDQAAEQAWLLVAIPQIMKHNYYYNCASIPKAGQTKATNQIKKALQKHPYKYGMVTDIHHFYETLPHSLVERGLRRIFKDEKFIQFAVQMMQSMSDTGVGIAIGHPVSHWFANVALMELDHKIERGEVGKGRKSRLIYVRYMDDMAFLCDNKRYLHKTLKLVQDYLKPYNMALKSTWQIFQVEKRGVQFLSYRFFYRKTILTKPLMYRISRKMRKASTNLSVLMAQGVMSYYGILKHCNSHNFEVQHVYPYVKYHKCRKVISNAHFNDVCRTAAQCRAGDCFQSYGNGSVPGKYSGSENAGCRI